MPLTFVGWDCSSDDTFITQTDIDALLSSGSKIAEFCVRCNQTLKEHNAEVWGKTGFDLPDPVTMAVALYPEIVTHQLDAYTYFERNSPTAYGQMVIDQQGLMNKAANATICGKINAKRFKEILFRLVQ
jgi:purine nucleosidase